MPSLKSGLITGGWLAAAAGATVAAGHIGFDQQATVSILLASLGAFGLIRAAGEGAEPDAVTVIPTTDEAPVRHEEVVSRYWRPDMLRDHAFLDDAGRLVQACDLGRHYGYENPDFDLAAYAIKNHGAAEVRGSVVRLRPSVVTRAAATAALSRLCDTADGPVQISAFRNSAWTFDRHPNAWAAAEAVLRMMEEDGNSPQSRGFDASTEPLDALDGTMAAAFRTWRDSAGSLDDGTVRRLQDVGAWDRTVALLPTRSSNFLFSHIGAGITVFGEEWRRHMIGREDDGSPDPSYAGHVTGLYRRSVGTQTPLVHRIQTDLRLRDSRPVRLTYRQLLLPWHVHDDDTRHPIVTSITQRLRPPVRHA